MKKIINISNKKVQVGNITLMPKESTEINEEEITYDTMRKMCNLSSLKLIKILNVYSSKVETETKSTKSKSKKKTEGDN